MLHENNSCLQFAININIISPVRRDTGPTCAVVLPFAQIGLKKLPAGILVGPWSAFAKIEPLMPGESGEAHAYQQVAGSTAICQILADEISGQPDSARIRSTTAGFVDNLLGSDQRAKLTRPSHSAPVFTHSRIWIKAIRRYH